MKHNLNLVTDPRFAWRTRRFSGYDIPPQEVAELYKLYTQTGGPSWINHTNWFANKQCSTWFGLTVAGGRVTVIDLRINNLAGVTGFSLRPFIALSKFYVFSNATLAMQSTFSDFPEMLEEFYSYFSQSLITGSLADLHTPIRIIYIGNSPSLITGSLSDLPATIQFLVVNGTESLITGTLSDLPASTLRLRLHSTPSLITGGASAMAAKGIDDIWLNSLSNPTIAAKDDIINRLYADRALFTNAAHDLNISGGEGPLTGVYQTSAAPSTPAEKAYALVNDPNSEDFLKWVITL
jgi:hypothetical protein